MKFTEFNLSPEVLRGIQEARFDEAMPVQEMVFKAITDGSRDVTVQSQTGSGKTAAFLVTLFQQMAVKKLDLAQPQVKALVMVPTRELASQIEDEAVVLSTGMKLRITTVYGGVGYGKQEEDLRSNPDLVIATPGRLLDLAGSGRVNLLTFTHLVIDEADRMLDMGFFPDIERILRQMATKDKRQTMLFSATLSHEVKTIATEFMRDPVDIVINPEKLTVDNIDQQLYHVGREVKVRLLLGLLRKYNPQNVLIFTNTKRMAEELARRLQENGFEAEYIIGDLPQKKRIKVIDSIKDGHLKFLVATDVASRGLHINDLAMVVNYDLPENPENYVHRIGRTARAGKSGHAISFACERDVSLLSPIEMFINAKLPVIWADDADYAEDKSTPPRHSFGRRDGFGDRGRGGDRGGRRGGDRSRGGDRGGYRGDRDRPRQPHAAASGLPQAPRQHEPPAAAGHPQPHAQSGRPAHNRQENSPSGRPRPERDRRPSGGRPHTGHAGPGHPESGQHHDAAPRRTEHGPEHRNEKRPDSRSPQGAHGAHGQHGRRDNRPARPHTGRPQGVPGQNSTVEERLAYYRQRYGGNFKVKELNEKPKKKGILDGIKGLFKKKK